MTWENQSLYDKINDRLNQYKRKYLRFKSSRDRITEYFRPDLNWKTDNNQGGGDFFGDSIYEGTAPWAARVMATGFQGNSVSMNIPWLMYEMDEFELRGLDRLDKFCQDVKEHMTAVYRKGNFYDVQPQFTLDALTIGSPVMFIEEIINEKKVVWLPQHYNHCYLSYDKFNRPNGIIVEDPNWTVKQIADTFCDGPTPEARQQLRKGKLSVALNKAYENGQYNDEFTIIRTVFGINDGLWNNEGFKKPVGRYQWVSVFFEANTIKKNEPLQTSGYFSRPFINWDYNKKVYEACSRTPAYEAIWDVLSSNQMYKNMLENVQLKNRPPVISLKTMQGRLDLLAEGQNWANDQNEMVNSPKMIDIIGDIRLSEEQLAMLDKKVERHFHIDVFQQAKMLAQSNKQPVSALQFWKMMGENATLLSPVIESHGRCLRDTDDIVMSIEKEAGRGPFDLDTMAEITEVILSNSKKIVDKVVVSPKFVGALYQAQKVQQEVEPIIRTLEMMTPIFAQFPETAFIIKQYELIDKLAQATDFPMDIINTKEDWQVIIDGIRQQAAQDKQIMQTIEAAKASKSIQGPVDKTSVMAGMANG